MKANDFFDNKVVQKINSDATVLQAANVISKKLAISLAGPDGGDWCFRFDETGQVFVDSDNSSPDCKITMKDKHFVKLIDGKLNLGLAFVTGKLKVMGSKGIAMEVAKHLRGFL